MKSRESYQEPKIRQAFCVSPNCMMRYEMYCEYIVRGDPGEWSIISMQFPREKETCPDVVCSSKQWESG